MAEQGFELEITELRLGLPGGSSSSDQGDKNEKKRVYSEMEKLKVAAPTNKSTAVVGWPPVCSYRRKSIGSEKECIEASKRLVKISMDGAPYLRKIDVSGFKQYLELVAAVEQLFGCSDLKMALENADNSEYVPIYEDKDGDWLLVGDVPWNMFVESCKRLRVMKRADAKGFEFQCKKQCHA